MKSLARILNILADFASGVAVPGCSYSPSEVSGELSTLRTRKPTKGKFLNPITKAVMESGLSYSDLTDSIIRIAHEKLVHLAVSAATKAHMDLVSNSKTRTPLDIKVGAIRTRWRVPPKPTKLYIPKPKKEKSRVEKGLRTDRGSNPKGSPKVRRGDGSRRKDTDGCRPKSR